MNRALLRALDRFSLYLPTVLMALLALATYWLVQVTPVPAPPAAEKPARTDPDYFMKNFTVRTYHESGRLRSEVFGASAKHFPADDVLEIQAVRIRSYDERGRLTTAVADRAITDSDGTQVELLGKAVVVREPLKGATGRQAQRIEFRGEHLHAHIDSERVVSKRPVEIRRGNEVFRADSLDFDNAQQWMELQGRVRGTLIPRGAQP